jgi:hypothetical protein
MIIRNKKRIITKQEASVWLKQKIKELNLEDLNELEDYANTTDDFELASEINLYIQAIL